ncbi:hypothetical protein LU226_06210 [Pantoea sp. Pb-8]|nr:hypothetical protein [Pantoea sp. Pb-8]
MRSGKKKAVCRNLAYCASGLAPLTRTTLALPRQHARFATKDARVSHSDPRIGFVD